MLWSPPRHETTGPANGTTRDPVLSHICAAKTVARTQHGPNLGVQNSDNSLSVFVWLSLTRSYLADSKRSAIEPVASNFAFFKTRACPKPLLATSTDSRNIACERTPCKCHYNDSPGPHIGFAQAAW